MNEHCTRRFFAMGGIALLALAANQVRKAYAIGSVGAGAETFSRSGDDSLDRALIQELKNIVRVLEINPGFQYVDVMNAFTTQEKIIEGTEGTVFLGLPFIKSLLKKDDGGVGVVGVCAHECAHIYQFKHHLDVRLNEKDSGVSSKRPDGDASAERSLMMELHADFIAGYYVGTRKGMSEQAVQRLFSTMSDFGTAQYKEPTSHGTSGQRTAAAERGFRTALNGIALAEAAETGISYVMNL